MVISATNEELQERFGVTNEQLEQWEKDACEGIFHGGITEGKVVIGRPMLFGQEMRQVGFKEPLDKIAAIDRRAKSLGMKRSDYLRWLVDQDLAQAAPTPA